MWIQFLHLFMPDPVLSRSNFHLPTFLPFVHLLYFVFVMHVPTSECVHAVFPDPKTLIHSTCPKEISPLNAYFSTPHSISITHLNKND